MDKLRMESTDMTEQNIEKIGKLFPNVITESKDNNGKLRKAINFDLLKQLLSADVLEGDEAYDFTWVGKKASIVEANKPIRKTLRPCKEESKNWDTTGNLYIEGDNLDVLKLLQESYLGKIKMIYIDPPYNTGNDFVYRDNFTRDKDEYDAETGVYGEYGDRLFRNTESNGRFHSDWCSMIHSRLCLARNLLSDDGVIFISIDDNENSSIKKICDEIFAEHNCLCQAVWDLGTGTTAGHFTRAHEYIMVYAKNKTLLPNFEAVSDENIVHGALKKISRVNPASEIVFPVGFQFEGDDAIFKGEIGGNEKEYILSGSMIFKDGKLAEPATIKAGWGMRRQIIEWIEGKETFDSKGQKIIRFYFNKQGILFYEKERGTYNPKSVFSNLANTKNGSQELSSLFGVKLFDFPKPTELIKYLVLLVSSKDGIILDFFSGSATTAHAVMQLNAEDSGNRKFIMVQVEEECAKDSEAYKAGYKNICEIGKERIRRAGEKIKADSGILAQDLDIGFRVFKLDSTNMKDVYYAAKDYSQGQLKDLISNIKEDRTDMDLLFACLLEWGLPLSLAHKTEKIDGFDVHTINDGDLMACFANEVSESVIREIAKRQPLRVVFRDSSFGTSPEKINVEEIFKLMSPKTTVKVI